MRKRRKGVREVCNQSRARLGRFGDLSGSSRIYGKRRDETRRIRVENVKNTMSLPQDKPLRRGNWWESTCYE